MNKKRLILFLLIVYILSFSSVLAKIYERNLPGNGEVIDIQGQFLITRKVIGQKNNEKNSPDDRLIYTYSIYDMSRGRDIYAYTCESYVSDAKLLAQGRYLQIRDGDAPVKIHIIDVSSGITLTLPRLATGDIYVKDNLFYVPVEGAVALWELGEDRQFREGITVSHLSLRDLYHENPDNFIAGFGKSSIIFLNMNLQPVFNLVLDQYAGHIFLGNLVYVVNKKTGEFEIKAINLEKKKIFWGKKVLSSAQESKLFIYKKTLLFYLEGEKIQAYNLSNGKLIWEKEMSRKIPGLVPVAVDNDGIFIINSNNILQKIGQEQGRVIKEIPLINPPAAFLKYGEVVYVQVKEPYKILLFTPLLEKTGEMEISKILMKFTQNMVYFYPPAHQNRLILAQNTAKDWKEMCMRENIIMVTRGYCLIIFILLILLSIYINYRDQIMGGIINKIPRSSDEEVLFMEFYPRSPRNIIYVLYGIYQAILRTIKDLLFFAIISLVLTIISFSPVLENWGIYLIGGSFCLMLWGILRNIPVFCHAFSPPDGSSPERAIDSFLYSLYYRNWYKAYDHIAFPNHKEYHGFADMEEKDFIIYAEWIHLQIFNTPETAKNNLTNLIPSVKTAQIARYSTGKVQIRLVRAADASRWLIEALWMEGKH